MDKSNISLVSTNNILVIPNELWSKLIHFLQDVNKNVSETKLQREIGTLAYLFDKYEQDVINSQRLYMTSHPCGYIKWEEEVVDRAIERLRHELAVMLKIKVNNKGE